MLESWQTAVKNFSTQKGHLGEGIEFYLSLQEKTSLLEKNAGDFIMARSDEKLELLKSLQRTFAAARPAPAAAPAATGVSSQQQAPGPGGLPSYIEERFDPASNMPYYVNHRDKTTSWERPK